MMMGKVFKFDEIVGTSIIPRFDFHDLDSARKSIIQRRVSIPHSQLILLSDKIQEKVISSEEFQKGKVVACFVGVRGEPDTSKIIRFPQKKIFLPVVKGDELSFYLFEGVLKTGSFGIPEPVSSVKVAPEDVELFIVPGLLFDLRGFRVGYGKGFYDRILSRKREGVPVFALSWSFQVFTEIPYNMSHDIFVNRIITEKFTVLCDERKVIFDSDDFEEN